MKRILITGQSSYIGNKLEAWLNQFEDYEVTKISLRDDKWKKYEFTKYDAIYHMVGIAHIKESKVDENLYYKVNRDLAIQIAEKAKNEEVQHFVLLSSMSVYGVENGTIDENTELKPFSNYGKSKLEAEKYVMNLIDEDFLVSIVRPPMVYGEGCKGNYQKLSKLANTLPIFPDITNMRSMIYIDNLTECLRLIIKQNDSSIYTPQNNEYVKTSDMVELISNVNKSSIFLTKAFNPLIYILQNVGVVKKMFGNLTYDQKLSNNLKGYQIVDFEKSIKITEGVK